MTLADHLERYLGTIDAGWSRDADGQEMPVEVVRFEQGERPVVVSFATLGLSRHPLVSATSGKMIRQELVMTVPSSLHDGPAPGLLQQISIEAIAGNRALVRGEVIGPRGKLFEGSVMEAVYVAIPVHLPDEFGVFRGEDGDIVIAWLVPISAAEAEYVARHGWRALEDLFMESDPDLADVFRPSVVVA